MGLLVHIISPPITHFCTDSTHLNPICVCANKRKDGHTNRGTWVFAELLFAAKKYNELIQIVQSKHFSTCLESTLYQS